MTRERLSLSEFRTIPPMLNDDEWNALLDHGLEKPASYIIRKKGSDYEPINGSTGKISNSGSDKAAVQQAIIDLLHGNSGGSIFLKDITLDSGVLATLPSDVLVIEDYQGKRTFYRDGKKLFELQDLADLVVEL